MQRARLSRLRYGTGGSHQLSLETRGSEGAEYELIGREMKVFWNTLSIAKTNELFDGASVSFEGGLGPACLNGSGDGVLREWREHERIIMDIEKGMGLTRKDGIVVMGIYY